MMNRLKVPIALGIGIPGVYLGYQYAVSNIHHGLPECAAAEDRGYKPFKPAPSMSVLLSEYRTWMKNQGVDTGNVELSVTDPKYGGVVATLSKNGKHLFSSGWLGLSRIKNAFKEDPVLISFPVENSISNASIAKNEIHRGLMKHLMEDDVHGYPVIIHIMIEKMKGDSSYLKQWLNMLPKRFSLPLSWTLDELEWLRGTSLYAAAMLQRKDMENAWSNMKHVCQEIASMEELHSSPTYEDFVWATSAFKMYAIMLPDQGGKTLSSQILPGTEMFEPSSKGHCTWELRGQEDASLCAVCSRKKKIVQGEPITISPWKGLSSEQMIFQYGREDVHPQDEVLMVNCPLPPPHEWTSILKKKIALLMHHNLRPQLFLSRSHLNSLHKSLATRGKYTGRKNRKRQQVFESMFPSDVLQTLEIFVIDSEELDARIKEIDGEPNRAESSEMASEMASEIASSGLRMAVLTTIVRLLELKIEELEGVETGTGSLENDYKILSAIETEQMNTTAMPHSGPTRHQLVALKHRMEQKKLTREYLKKFNSLLQDEMEYLHKIREQES